MSDSVLIKTKSLQQHIHEGFPTLNWRINKILPSRGITILGGSSGSYKTWAAMQLALACASGNNFLENFPVEKCNVLYVDEENGDITLLNRFQMLINGFQLKDDFNNLHLSIFDNIKLDDEKNVGRLASVIKRNNIKVVIFDSMVRCMNGEEDKARDVRKVFENLKKLFTIFPEISFVILHHTSKGKGNSMDKLRGSGDFAAFADVILMFNTFHNKIVNLDCVKNRHIDLSKFNKFSFEVNQVNNGEGLTLGYLPYKSANVDVIGLCKDDIINFIEEKNLEAYNSKDLLKSMKRLGHTRHSFYAAHGYLQDENYIQIIKKGRYRVLGSQITLEEVD